MTTEEKTIAIAEKVMGWQRKEAIGYYDGDKLMAYGFFWSPTTDIVAFWQVVEKMRSYGRQYQWALIVEPWVDAYFSFVGFHYHFSAKVHRCRAEWSDGMQGFCEAGCKAAWLAVMEEKE